MVLNNIKLKKDRGFTIVELLVVIVVIAILAAITIVSYTGITTRAKDSQAKSNANSVQSVAEAMHADNGYYPRLSTDFTTGSQSTKLPSGITIFYTGDTAIGDGNGTTKISYEYCGDIAAPAAGAAKGGRIRYWDYTATPPALKTTYIYVGTGSASGGAGSAPCHTWVVPAS